MLRSCHASSLARSSLRSVTRSSIRGHVNNATRDGLISPLNRLVNHRSPVTTALSVYKPFSTSLLRLAQTYDKIDRKHEEELEHEKLVPHPEEVSPTSTVHEVFHEKGVEDPEKDEDMLAGMKSDWVGALNAICM